jgi:hypothetical protein
MKVVHVHLVLSWELAMNVGASLLGGREQTSAEGTNFGNAASASSHGSDQKGVDNRMKSMLGGLSLKQ